MLETNCSLSCHSINTSKYSRREGARQLAEVVRRFKVQSCSGRGAPRPYKVQKFNDCSGAMICADCNDLRRLQCIAPIAMLHRKKS